MAPALAIPALAAAGKYAMGKLPLLMATGRHYRPFVRDVLSKQLYKGVLVTLAELH